MKINNLKPMCKHGIEIKRDQLKISLRNADASTSRINSMVYAKVLLTNKPEKNAE